jgi:hypothetical protein
VPSAAPAEGSAPSGVTRLVLPAPVVPQDDHDGKNLARLSRVWQYLVYTHANRWPAAVLEQNSFVAAY